MPDEDRHRQSRLFTDDDGGFDAERAREQSLPVEDGDVIDTDDLAEHQQYVEGRGVYDERNRVNDLTGREWKFATKSVIAEGYPPAVQHELRSEHGGQKPPRLCAELIGRFSKAGDTVLDPFAGVGGTLLGASFCEHEGTGLREAIGFEQTERWTEIYENVLEQENAARRDRGEPPLAAQEMRHGDCADLIDDLADDSVDLLLTDVPYWHMDELEQTRNERATRESKLGSFDGSESDGGNGGESGWDDDGGGESDGDGRDESDGDGGGESDGDGRDESDGDGGGESDGDGGGESDRGDDGAASTGDGDRTATGPPADDQSTQTKAEWLEEMATKFDQFTDAVAPDGHVVVFIGDMYRDQSYEFLSADLARALEADAGLTLAANLIWYDPTKDLHVYGYPFSFVPSMVHQNVLVFRLADE